MFWLTQEEAELSRSQIAILNSGRGSNIKYLPHAVTERGAIQAGNVLNSPWALESGVPASFWSGETPLKLLHLSDLDGLDQPMTVHALERHVGE